MCDVVMIHKAYDSQSIRDLAENTSGALNDRMYT